MDALPEALQLISKGELAGTVLNDSVNQGKAVVQLSNNLAQGKSATEGTKWELKTVLYAFLMLVWIKTT